MCLQSRCCHRTGETKGIIPPGFLEGEMQTSWSGGSSGSGRAQGQETLVSFEGRTREMQEETVCRGDRKLRAYARRPRPHCQSRRQICHGEGERAGAQGEEGSETGWGEGQRARSPHEVRACSAKEVRPGARAMQRPGASKRPPGAPLGWEAR